MFGHKIQLKDEKDVAQSAKKILKINKMNFTHEQHSWFLQ